MKIYTKTGDRGQTALFSGERVAKDSLRVAAYGTLDELNSLLGVAASVSRSDVIQERIETLQNLLFNAGADMATTLDSKRKIGRVDEDRCQLLEGWIDEMEEDLPPLKNFILPGGSPAASHLHMARSVCRRAERKLVTLMRREEMNPHLLIFLNRLSDLLFVMARYENIKGGGREVLWTG
ncbi:MAG TPA: cob(I)yrinic acid a,c-diamide adenosyltransferase [Acidobacteriota bacterium]|nr:cob(I)yrinic acid a,c-diamide adenosyltransferase [Acidobacteriota bacterium]